MLVATCFSVLLDSQWSQHFLTWLLVFSNSKILSALILLCPISSLNWAIKLFNWATVSLLEIVMWFIPDNNLVGQLYHTFGVIDSFQFCVSLIYALYVVVIVWCRVQYRKYFPSFSYFTTYFSYLTT